MHIRAMLESDYDAMMACWLNTPGVGVNDCDTPEGISAYLRRNPGLSLVAEHNGKLVGTILCGHDGRRAYVHHMWVDTSMRRLGLGKQLFEQCMELIKPLGLGKAHMMVWTDNHNAQKFWHNVGCEERTDLKLFTYHCDAPVKVEVQ